MTINYEASTWDIGFIVGLSLFTLLAVLAAVIAVWAFAEREFLMGSLFGCGSLVLVLIALLIAFPFEKHYHAWVPVSGTVQQVDKRLLPDGDGMQEKIVVVYEGSSLQFGCEDTRCASVRPGDQLSMKCKTQWDYQGADGRDCKFVSFETTGQR